MDWKRELERKSLARNKPDRNPCYYLLRLFVFLYQVLLPALRQERSNSEIDTLCMWHLRREWTRAKQDLFVLVYRLAQERVKEFYMHLDQSNLLFFDNEHFIYNTSSCPRWIGWTITP